MTFPLRGVRVLDLARHYPGGYCTLLLADLGAEVVKVEAPGAGDPLRGPAGTSPAHIGLNRGKRSITLDTRRPAGLDVLRRLVAGADAVVDSSRPGALEEAGFGYPQAAAVNPRLVWAALSAFGADGPYAGRAGHEVTFLGQSGALAAMAEQLPWMPQTAIAAPMAGAVAAMAVAAALAGAARTGTGCFVDASITDASTWLLSGMPAQFTAGAPKLGWAAGRRLYRCADDRWVSVSAAESRTWHALCRVLDADDLADRLTAPVEEQAAMAERFEKVFVTRPAAQWMESDPAATIGAVNEGPDLLTDPHASARGALVDVMGTLVPATPVRLRDAEGRRSSTPTTGPPALGADTDEILLAAGVPDGELARLRADGII
ncbi:carnitine dehydratase [Parafrankia soli]|uniref:Carnitine dehydratase n=1 Tax=Parafrankia soli TaxID=2599596 RepID=A0A1S1QT29_9ACTN|nr:CaiB/BaiF CoA-transferase family protein [Parafrankia soli]OHV36746.1 carnitine dehydratase [Parafrankia soli]CAI7979886.1 Carnitine dehydratase [Frankia sp. Hr75.2]